MSSIENKPNTAKFISKMYNNMQPKGFFCVDSENVYSIFVT